MPNPVAFFGKREAILQDEKCPFCLALFSIAADENDASIGTGTDRYCMYAIPSQLAYRSQETPSNGGFEDRFLQRAKVQGDSTWLVIRNQSIHSHAITVALELKIAYIWIDRYCVPQQDCPEKLEQIQKMHEIYREADLTIIAAAGHGPDYGLPGISASRVKAPSADVRIGFHRIVSTGKSAQETIRSKVWASRAWTYQEGLVSGRKLIFTDEQVYLHCMQREFRETIDQDYSLLAKSDNDDLATPFQYGILHLIPQKHGLESVYWLMQESSKSICEGIGI
ncbi:hypothetical protein ACHAQD_005617 [Fusarium lateritium]